MRIKRRNWRVSIKTPSVLLLLFFYSYLSSFGAGVTVTLYRSDLSLLHPVTLSLSALFLLHPVTRWLSVFSPSSVILSPRRHLSSYASQPLTLSPFTLRLSTSPPVALSPYASQLLTLSPFHPTPLSLAPFHPTLSQMSPRCLSAFPPFTLSPYASSAMPFHPTPSRSPRHDLTSMSVSRVPPFVLKISHSILFFYAPCLVWSRELLPRKNSVSVIDHWATT